jgi:hypothetical protein
MLLAFVFLDLTRRPAARSAAREHDKAASGTYGS